MKFELKTENQNHTNSFSNIFRTISLVFFVIIFCDIAFKFGFISRHYQIEYNCNLLLVDKSQSSFKKLSRLSNLKSKQKIWEFCREIVK